MKKEYLQPATEEILFRLEMSVLSGNGTGSDMDDPEEYNPF